MKKTLVSICTLVYNHEKYLRQCLDAFIMQETNFDFEVLIHDDASTDGSVDIIREYEEKYPEIVKPIYQKENKYSNGVGISVTYQFPRAKGKYIAMCEGDDYWTDPLKLQKQVDFLEANPEYVISFHNSYIIKENDDDKSEPTSKIPLSFQRDSEQIELIRAQVYIPTQTMCYRNVIKSFPKEMKGVPNGDTFLFSLLGNYGKAKFQGEIKPACYRVHSGGIWSTRSALEKALGNKITFKNLFKYYKKHKRKSDVKYFRKTIQLGINNNIYLNAIHSKKKKMVYKYFLLNSFNQFKYFKFKSLWFTMLDFLSFLKHTYVFRSSK